MVTRGEGCVLEGHRDHRRRVARVDGVVEHSDSQFESIHRFILSESIRLDSFCEIIGLSIH